MGHNAVPICHRENVPVHWLDREIRRVLGHGIETYFVADVRMLGVCSRVIIPG